MSTSKNRQQGAQNQHYVPKFILRNFLRDPEKDQVNVFQKSTGRGFVTSVKNVMAERRFHDFDINSELYATFEPSIGKIEDMLLPRYNKILENRCLEQSEQERADLGWLVAFQTIRTRAWREKILEIQKKTEEHIASLGYNVRDVEGFNLLSEQEIKYEQIEFIKKFGGELALIVAEKDMFLFEPPPGRSFYVSDNPVCLSNTLLKPNFYGNIGFGLPGIEIYLPLSADLVLAVWCPSVTEFMKKQLVDARSVYASNALRSLRNGRLSVSDMKNEMDNFDEATKSATSLLEQRETGKVSQFSVENMDYVNSLQMQFAREFVVCRDGNFDLARRFMNDNPAHCGLKMV